MSAIRQVLTELRDSVQDVDEDPQTAADWMPQILAAEAELEGFENGCAAAARQALELGTLQGQIAERDRADAELREVYRMVYLPLRPFEMDAVAQELDDAFNAWFAKGGTH